ncbi:hypothetical protein SEA_ROSAASANTEWAA_26 [Streptomyces phage RosaAsantewaa]|nr:hypothetical protein SEA_ROSAASANTEWAA_26 [Streptomyces phage RosaAsantewaa]
MLNLKKTNDPTPLDAEIDRLLNRLSEIAPDSDEYAKTNEQLIKLYKLNEDTNSKKRVSPDALAQVAGSLAGIVLILGYERAGIITSKAMSFVMKSAR